MLLFTAVVSPYRIAFIETDSLNWLIVESAIDCVFGIDMILNFCFAYFDSKDEVVDLKQRIALKYLRGWFWIDFITVFPISQIMDTSSYNKVARMARLPKLYRLIKIVR
jgi:hypothetical protein